MSDKKNILVIEDNKEVLDGILELLKYCGYNSTGSIDFNDEILEKYKTGHFDLLILDVMLSGKDGRDLARKLKNMEGANNIPIILISAYTNMEESIRESMADDFLQKPFGLEELREKVEANL